MKSCSVILIWLSWAAALLSHSPAVAENLSSIEIQQTAEPNPSTVQIIVNPGRFTIPERIKAVHELNSQLSQKDIGLLCAFVEATGDANESNLVGFHVLKNDILNVLRNQDLPPTDLIGLLLKMYRNHLQDPVIRDYAIQHLTSWFNSVGGDSNVLEQVQTALREAVMERGSIAGTALLGWHRLSKNYGSFSSREINEWAVSLAISSETHHATRITAVQVCSERNLKEALPEIRALAHQRGDIPLRLSAIAALGRLGTADEIETLRRLGAETGEPVQAAVKAALDQLSEKHKVF